MDMFQKLTQGFRETANKPIRDTFAMGKAAQKRHEELQNSWHLDDSAEIPVISEPYIEKSAHGDGFRVKRYYTMDEKDYAQQLKILDNEPENYRFEYPELFNEMSAERGVIESKTKSRFPEIDLDDPSDITRHRLHLKMHYQQSNMDKRNAILDKIMTIQQAKIEKGIALDLPDIASNGRNAAQKAHMILRASENAAATSYNQSVNL